MRIVAIIQARMGSTRLPGKVLKDVGGQTVLGWVINRLRRSRLINELLVATTDQPEDDAILAECQKYSATVFRGEQSDVLDRYHRAAEVSRADLVVRITSDCPLIDPEITDQTIAAFLRSAPDYASNALIRTYPRGLDTEVFSAAALGRAWREAREPHEREHVTPYIYEHPAAFKILTVTGDTDYGSYRWTVDTPEDLELIRAICNRFEQGDSFSWRDVIAVFDREPHLAQINSGIVQKALREA